MGLDVGRVSYAKLTLILCTPQSKANQIVEYRDGVLMHVKRSFDS
jgi:hypothetical protein